MAREQLHIKICRPNFRVASFIKVKTKTSNNNLQTKILERTCMSNGLMFKNWYSHITEYEAIKTKKGAGDIAQWAKSLFNKRKGPERWLGFPSTHMKRWHGNMHLPSQLWGVYDRESPRV